MDKKKYILFFRNIYIIFLDILFPITCIGCGYFGNWFCEKCSATSFHAIDQFCPVCEKAKTPDGKICFSCKKKSPLSGLFVCASYKEKIVSKMIHCYKYRFISDLSIPLGEIMTKKILASSMRLPDIIAPVPLNQKRLRWRGFNQSALLAKLIAGNLTPGIHLEFIDNLLTRNVNTKSQMKIKKYQERMANVAGAFSVNRNIEIKGKTIMIIDDIATTGSTIFECAKTLKDSGAKEVFAVVLTRQEIKSIK